MCQLGTESQQDYIALPLHVQMIPVKILFFSDYDFDADYDDSCVNDHEDCEIDDDIDVDSVGAVGVEDNLGLNPQETLSLKHRGLQIIRCSAVHCSAVQSNA